MTITNELIYTVQNAKCPEDFVKIAKDNDAIISIENAKMLFMAIQALKFFLRNFSKPP